MAGFTENFMGTASGLCLVALLGALTLAAEAQHKSYAFSYAFRPTERLHVDRRGLAEAAYSTPLFGDTRTG